MDGLINKLATARGVIQRLDILPTESNCNLILACLQILHSAEDEISKLDAEFAELKAELAKLREKEPEQ